MSRVVELPVTEWNQPRSAELQSQAVSALEGGNALFFPQLAFPVETAEAAFFSPDTVTNRKNISLNPVDPTATIRGSSLEGAQAKGLETLMRRFAEFSHQLLLGLMPGYEHGLIVGRTSFRPVEIEGRTSSWRKDDTRLHVDSFPASPVQDKRILRVFANVNPEGQGRSWRLGEPFEVVAKRFMPQISRPVPGSSQLLRALKITKSRRTEYDHYMLQMHDQMKADQEYQKKADQIHYTFPAGSAWIVYTDQASHAAMAGQYALEQTYYLPVSSMARPETSPLKVLERLAGRALV